MSGRAFGLILAMAALGCSNQEAQKPAAPPLAAPPLAAPPPAAEQPAPVAPAPEVTGPLRFLAIGGGPTPESNEVSLEQDIELVQRTLAAPGHVLFSGGSGSVSVRELDPRPKGDPLLLALGDLFAPRSGRQSRYRAPRFAAEAATLGNVELRLTEALAQAAPPLVVYFAGHGDQGAEAKANSMALWANGALSVARLAELHEQQRRSLRLVATSCFSGGFADLAFERADAAAGRPSRVPRCGVFAGTWDRETSGCDPNPDRRQQESYALHFLHALAATRRDGAPLPLGALDLDRDGKLGLLDAHTHARIESLSLDVPTTTSERWLRRVEANSAPIDEKTSPEDAAVVARLGAALGLPNERAALKRWSELDRQLSELEAALDSAEEDLGAREAELGGLLLARWPVLDDPFHPDFAATLARDRDAIERALGDAPETRARAVAKDRVSSLYDRLGSLAVEEARVFRLCQAYETLHKASALLARGGAAAKYYSALRACERAPL
jgi:hypothetical protein